MSSVLSSCPVILRALLITETRWIAADGAALAIGCEIAAGRFGSIRVGAGTGATSTLSRGGVTALPLASAGLSVRVNMVMVGSPEVGRTFQKSSEVAKACARRPGHPFRP